MPEITGYPVLDGLLLLIAAGALICAVAFAAGAFKAGEMFDTNPAEGDHTRPPTE